MQEIRSLNSGGHSTSSSETGSRAGITTTMVFLKFNFHMQI